jgi:tetratricopeptide (TPR) repeat protein/predicted phosphodiesterase
MAGLNWLHLSDWHQKGNEFDRQVVLKALLKDIRERERINPCLQKLDFVIFSGDIAYSGKAEEYQTAKEQFFQPLLDACGLTEKQLFIVPGNHDLDRDEFRFLPCDLTKPLATEAAVQSWLTDDRSRSRLLEPFRAFSSFVKDYTGQEQADYVNVRRIPIGDREVALLGLNSAWMCGRNKAQIGDKGFVIVGEPQIHSAIDEISDTDLKIAVLHHPFDWLTEFDCNRIETRLMQGCDFILRGHQHKPKVEVTSGTSGICVIIPAGASYDRRMADNPFYVNSYNFVHLDLATDKGIVFLRRWSDPRNKWVKDIDSCDDGECDFSLSGSVLKASSPDIVPQSIKLIPRQIPPPPRDFKGREDEISDILSSFAKGATITGLRGMGGIGKTALALVLADRIKSQFPDGQIFVDMWGTSNNPDLPPLTPEDAMAQIIRAYNPVDRLPENSGELRGLYHSVLAGKRVLLLLDNAASGEQVEPLMPSVGCAVLITSRIRFVLPGLSEKDLDILPLDKACELLIGIAPRIGNRAEELAEICGRLPIALRKAASALAERQALGVPEYERLLTDKVSLLKLVQGSFSLSYDLLTPERKEQWRRLSVFPEDFDLNAATAILKMAPGPSAEALSDLVRWSMLDFAEVSDLDGRYKLHELARLFAESCLDQEELDDSQQKHAKYYSELLSQAYNLYQKGGTNLLAGLKLFDHEWANIKIGQAWVKKMVQGTNKFNKKELKSVFQLAISYVVDGSNVLDLRLHPQEKIRWLETGIKAAKMIRDRSAQGVLLDNLGAACADLGQTRKAIEHYEMSLKISSKIGDRRCEESALSNMGIAYKNLGDVRKAIGYYEQSLAIDREIGDKRSEGYALGNLGSVYKHLGYARKAIMYYEQALKVSREIGDRRGEGKHLGNLGIAHRHLGDARKAIEYHEQQLAIDREIGDKRGAGYALGNLGLAYTDLGYVRKAIEYHEQHLAIDREIGDKRGAGYALGSLGLAYADLGDACKAIEYHEQHLAIDREIGDKRGEGHALGNLGLAYADLGDARKAIEYHEQHLAIDREIGDKRGEGHALGNLGLAYAVLGDTLKAINYYEDALVIAREIEDKKNEGEELCTLGKAYSDLYQLDKALDHIDQALKIFKDIEYRRGEGEALFAKSLALYELNQQSEAVSLANQALQIFVQIESPLAEKVRQQLEAWQSPKEN